MKHHAFGPPEGRRAIMLSRRALSLTAGAGGVCVVTGVFPGMGEAGAASLGSTRSPPGVRVSIARFDTGDIIDLIPPDRAPPGRPPVPTRHLPFMTALAAQPENQPASGRVLIIHDEWGLDDTAQELALACADQGLAAYAVDALSPYGGTPSGRTARGRDRAARDVRQLDPEKTFAKLSRVASAVARDGAPIGLVGFGWGADLAIRLSLKQDDIAAAAVFLNDAATLPPLPSLLVHLPDASPPVQERNGLTVVRHAGARAHFWRQADGLNYNAAAARRSAALTIEFMAQRLRP